MNKRQKYISTVHYLVKNKENSNTLWLLMLAMKFTKFRCKHDYLFILRQKKPRNERFLKEFMDMTASFVTVGVKNVRILNLNFKTKTRSAQLQQKPSREMLSYEM